MLTVEGDVSIDVVGAAARQSRNSGCDVRGPR